MQIWCFWINFWLPSSEERLKSLVSLFCEKYIHSMLKVSFSDLAEKLIIQLLCSFGAFEFFWLIISEERPKSLVSLFKENNIQKNLTFSEIKIKSCFKCFYWKHVYRLFGHVFLSCYQKLAQVTCTPLLNIA